MKWTPDKIRAWQLETFGEPESRQLVVARALVEAAELLLEASRKEPDPDKIAEEAADVAIVLALDTQYEDAATIYSASRAAMHLNTTLLIWRDRLESNPEWSAAAAVLSWTKTVCRAVGRDLAAAIDAKMEKNVARKWSVEGGVGRHLRKANFWTEDRYRLRREGFEIAKRYCISMGPSSCDEPALCDWTLAEEKLAKMSEEP